MDDALPFEPVDLTENRCAHLGRPRAPFANRWVPGCKDRGQVMEADFLALPGCFVRMHALTVSSNDNAMMRDFFRGMSFFLFTAHWGVH